MALSTADHCMALFLHIQLPGDEHLSSNMSTHNSRAVVLERGHSNSLSPFSTILLVQLGLQCLSMFRGGHNVSIKKLELEMEGNQCYLSATFPDPRLAKIDNMQCDYTIGGPRSFAHGQHFIT